jgi:Tol biopolymer transport system component
LVAISAAILAVIVGGEAQAHTDAEEGINLIGTPSATLSFVRGGSVRVASHDLHGSTVYLAARHERGWSYTYSRPAWSPDGTALAATELESPPPTTGLFPSERLVVERASGRVFSPCSDCAGEYASWSPDGERLAYLYVEFYSPYLVGELHVLSLATGPDAYVTPYRDLPVDSSPAWSPDGKLIAFVRLVTNASGAYTRGRHILVIAPTGGAARRLEDADATNLNWSPDGKYIAFDDGRRIGIVARSGGPVRYIATGIQPAWSPDGSMIAYVDDGNVWLVDASRPRPRLAIRNATQPAWRPAR